MQPLLTITRKFDFCYGHWLPDYDGKCANMHGHNAVLEIEVKEGAGRDDTYPTMIMDFGDLKEIVEREVILHLDHKVANDLLEYPTAENMVRWMWDKLTIPGLFYGSLVRIRLYETPNCYAEIRR